jgi:hypothetical protein
MTVPPRPVAAAATPIEQATSKHGDPPTSDGAVRGALGDSEVILMGAQGA